MVYQIINFIKSKFVCLLLLPILVGENNEKNNLNLSIIYIQAQNMKLFKKNFQ